MNHLKFFKVFFIVSTIWLVVLAIKNHFPSKDQDQQHHEHTSKDTHKHNHEEIETDPIAKIIEEQGQDHLKDLSFTNQSAIFIQQADLTSLKKLISDNPSIKSNVDSPSKEDGRTLLTRASFGGNLSIIKYLVEELGADIEKADAEKITPLMEAVSSENLEVFEYYLSKKIDIHATNKLGADALTMAMSGSSDEMISKLLRAGANPNHSWNKKNFSHLMLSSRNGNLLTSKLLLNAGAEINARDTEGNTALHYASAEGFTSIVKLLISRGSNLESKNTKNESAGDLALENGFKEIADLLP